MFYLLPTSPLWSLLWKKIGRTTKQVGDWEGGLSWYYNYFFKCFKDFCLAHFVSISSRECSWNILHVSSHLILSKPEIIWEQHMDLTLVDDPEVFFFLCSWRPNFIFLRFNLDIHCIQVVLTANLFELRDTFNFCQQLFNYWLTVW